MGFILIFYKYEQFAFTIKPIRSLQLKGWNMKTDAAWDESNQEYVMPCAEAVLMATMALMTGHAQNKNEQHLQWMARKIGANLEVLASHPGLSEGFRKALKRLVVPWAQQSAAPDFGSRVEA
ncbi:hypothetical protein [Limnohabitans sp.]|uniref:hypothetical protein n=1 Tax=Limnohabitans sp. TaxID=1907725 RepID=UPI0037C0C8CE